MREKQKPRVLHRKCAFRGAAYVRFFSIIHCFGILVVLQVLEYGHPFRITPV